MREIRFRAFYREDKMWLTVTTLDFMQNADGSLPILCDGYKDNGEHMSFGLHEVDLCQYTGLKDKNGKEIYEGDIVTNGEYEYVVEWTIAYDGTPMWGGKNISSPLRRDIDWHDKEIIVIGNIYSNPNLLTKE